MLTLTLHKARMEAYVAGMLREVKNIEAKPIDTWTSKAEEAQELRAVAGLARAEAARLREARFRRGAATAAAEKLEAEATQTEALADTADADVLRMQANAPIDYVDVKALMSSSLLKPYQLGQVPADAARDADSGVRPARIRGGEFPEKTLWTFRTKVYDADPDLTADDVKALIDEKASQRQRRLEKAHNAQRGARSEPATSRDSIPREVRYAVWQRDQNCTTCGSGFDLHYEHIVPTGAGGSTSVDNLRLLCDDCFNA